LYGLAVVLLIVVVQMPMLSWFDQKQAENVDTYQNGNEESLI